MKSIDELAANLNFATAKTGEDRSVTFLPDPPRAQRRYAVISVDDHIVEPPDTFTRRFPRKFADRAPGVVDTDSGGQMGVYGGQELPNVGFNAVVGRPVYEYGFEPVGFDEMRRGAWDLHERVNDMDLNGIYVSLNFSSFLPGLAGQRLQQVTTDRDLALASVRAWNDWQLEVWAGSYPERIIPCQLPWLLDPELGASMIHENAGRGFHAVTFSENPAMLGLPSIHSGHWDPMMAACAETGTVVKPPHRIVWFVSVHNRGRATRCGWCAVLRLCHFGGGRLIVLRPAQQVPGSQDLFVRRRNRVGWLPGYWIASTTCSAITRCMAPGRHSVRV
jgi:hypothetical protein